MMWKREHAKGRYHFLRARLRILRIYYGELVVSSLHTIIHVHPITCKLDVYVKGRCINVPKGHQSSEIIEVLHEYRFISIPKEP